jgi:hypothetical protein
MAAFDDALERMLNDQTFTEQVARDPHAALNGYDLSPDERHLLYTSVIGAQDGERAAEPRAARVEPAPGRPGRPDVPAGDAAGSRSGFGPPTSASGFGPEGRSGFGQPPRTEASWAGDQNPDGWHDLREAERRGVE